MKTFLTLAFLVVSFASFCQKNKLYKTVFDDDNNLIARGIFKSAADSGVIILVDDLEIFVNATEITILKIEKNPSTSEFLKLGATAAMEAGSYLINNPKKNQEASSTHSNPPDTSIISTETKDALFKRINKLIDDLISGKNDLATININNSAEKFLSKLRILQEYSMEKEVVAWNDYSQNQQTISEIENPEQDLGETLSDQNIQTESSSNPVKPSISVPVKSKNITLGRGFYLVKPNPVKVPTSGIKSINNNDQAPSLKKGKTVVPSTRISGEKKVYPKRTKPVILVPVGNGKQVLQKKDATNKKSEANN